MTKFNVSNVGDKVRILDAKIICGNGTGRLTTGNEYEILSFHEKCGGYVERIKVADNFSNPFTICDWEYKYIEIVEAKPTKNQRITALENEVAELRPLKQEVAELKLIVHELRGKKSIEPSTTNAVEDIIEFEGAKYRRVEREAQEGDVVDFARADSVYQNEAPFKVLRGVKFDTRGVDSLSVYNNENRTPETVDVYELIEGGLNPQIPIVDEMIEPLTPNQQRAAIIEKAKQFVEEKLKLLISYDFVVINNGTKLYSRQRFQEFKLTTTKCSPNDVFNEHIGKAIALGRALGLDVSEFEQAVQPTEFVTGQIITYTSELAGRDRGGNFEISYIEDDTLWFDDERGYDLCDEDWKPKIINDTNAIYEEGQ